MKALINFICFLGALPGRKIRQGMALVKLGGGVVDLRGSIGGTVFSRNRSGAIARARTIPINPGSEAQQKIRSIMSVCRNAWYNVLTSAQRDAWATYAEAVEIQNRLGETIKLTGFNHFVRSASCALYNDLAYADDAPTELSLPEQDETLALVATVSDGKLAITFDEDGAWLDEDDSYLIVYCSRGQSATVNYFKGPYLIAGKIAGDSVTPPTTGAELDSPYTLVEGQKVFIQCRILRADGRLSEPFRGSVLVTAGT